MAKKTTPNKVEVKEALVQEAVAPLKIGNTSLEVEQSAKTHQIKRTIIANAPTVFRKTTTLDSRHIVGTMPTGVAFEIVREVKSIIYGNFYQLKNGYYITQNGNYSIF